MFVRMPTDEEMTRKLGIKGSHVDQCAQHSTILSSTQCLNVVGTVRKRVSAVILEFSSCSISNYIDALIADFELHVTWMYGKGPIEPNIPTALRDFGLSIEHDWYIYKTKAGRKFMFFRKGEDALSGRTSRVKLGPSIVMHWRYEMDTKELAQRMMIQGKMSRSNVI